MVMFLLGASQPNAPLYIYQGDGLTVIVTEWSEDTGAVSGQIRHGDATYPFTGKAGTDSDPEVVNGAFTANGQQHAFVSRPVEGSDEVIFSTGGKDYRLRPGNAPQQVDAPKPAPPNVNAGANAPPVMRLKLHAFPDVSMGGATAYTVMLPDGWNSQGKIEWSGGELSYPQPTFEITSPEGGRIRFIPAITLSYTEVNPVPGFDPIPPQGVPAPQNFPQWLVSAKSQTNAHVSNVTLVDSKRLTQVEQQHKEFQAGIGARDDGMQREVWQVTLEYDEAGARRREDAIMMYVRYPPNINQNLSSQMWSVFTTYIISAPKDKFEALKPQLYTIASSVRPTPQWWTQSQALLAELSRMRIENRAAEIRRRGQMLNQMSDADYQKYRQNFSSDSAQRDRINTIYETSDYRDTTGQIVNLPMHYHHVFSDGKGNYVLSNNSQDKPGELWTPIEPMK